MRDPDSRRHGERYWRERSARKREKRAARRAAKTQRQQPQQQEELHYQLEKEHRP